MGVALERCRAAAVGTASRGAVVIIQQWLERMERATHASRSLGLDWSTMHVEQWVIKPCTQQRERERCMVDGLGADHLPFLVHPWYLQMYRRLSVGAELVYCQCHGGPAKEVRSPEPCCTPQI